MVLVSLISNPRGVYVATSEELDGCLSLAGALVDDGQPAIVGRCRQLPAGNDLHPLRCRLSNVRHDVSRLKWRQRKTQNQFKSTRGSSNLSRNRRLSGGTSPMGNNSLNVMGRRIVLNRKTVSSIVVGRSEIPGQQLKTRKRKTILVASCPMMMSPVLDSILLM